MLFRLELFVDVCVFWSSAYSLSLQRPGGSIS